MKRPSDKLFDGALVVLIVGMILALLGLIHDLYTGTPSI